MSVKISNSWENNHNMIGIIVAKIFVSRKKTSNKTTDGL